MQTHEWMNHVRKALPRTSSIEFTLRPKYLGESVRFEYLDRELITRTRLSTGLPSGLGTDAPDGHLVVEGKAINLVFMDMVKDYFFPEDYRHTRNGVLVPHRRSLKDRLILLHNVGFRGDYWKLIHWFDSPEGFGKACEAIHYEYQRYEPINYLAGAILAVHRPMDEMLLRRIDPDIPASIDLSLTELKELSHAQRSY